MSKKNKPSKQNNKTVATPVKKAEEVKNETPVTETKTEAAEEPKKPVEQKPVNKPEKQEETPMKPTKEKPQQQAQQARKPGSKKTKPEKIEEVEAEEVTNDEISRGLSKIANGERIDANRSIDLMGAIKSRYLSGNDDVPENLKAAMSTQYDIMLYVNMVRWNVQTKDDFKEAGMVINSEVFDKLALTVREALGITLKALPAGNEGQLKIDFKNSNETASPEVQEALKKEETRKVVKEVPEYKEGMSEEEVLKALDDIFGMTGNGMEGNLYNAIEFARKAFKQEKEEPHQILRNILTKLDHLPIVLKGFEGISYGSVLSNGNPFLAHLTMLGKMSKYKYTEKQVANLVKSFISDQIERNILSSNGTLTESEFLSRSVPIEELFGAFNDKLINQILTSEEMVAVPTIKGLSYSSKKEEIDRGKIINGINKVYGELNPKELKKKLQEIAGLYFGKLENIKELSK